ncbi:hypothetical protein [Neobacillus niacini]|uniref:hypothetical protein n=1 Tax=Neobacillus niacini TaxID=86668 RepID=UPI002040EA22|nr:hypothetical protein [Neobacillus niacini]
MPSTLVKKLVAKDQVEIIAPISDLVEMQAAGIYLSGKMMENKDLAVRFLAGYIESARLLLQKCPQSCGHQYR